MLTRRGKPLENQSKPVASKSSIPIRETRLRSAVRQAAITSLNRSNVMNQMTDRTNLKQSCHQIINTKPPAQSRSMLQQPTVFVRSIRTEVLKKEFNTAKAHTETAKARISAPVYSLRPRLNSNCSSKQGSMCQDKKECNVGVRKLSTSETTKSNVQCFGKDRKMGEELIRRTTRGMASKLSISDATFVIPAVPKSRSQKRPTAELSQKSSNSSAINSRRQRPSTIMQPCSSSTPMKNVFRNSCAALGSGSTLVLHLSPIMVPENKKTPAAKYCKKTIMKPGKENKSQESPSSGEYMKIRNSSEYKQNLVYGNKVSSIQKSSSKELVETATHTTAGQRLLDQAFDAMCDYTSAVKKPISSSSSSTGTDSNSGERDPLKLFILNDPIKLSSKPKARKYKFATDNFDDFPASRPNKQPKTNAKKEIKADMNAALCHDRMKLWLEEVEQLKAELEDVEKMELCVETSPSSGR